MTKALKLLANGRLGEVNLYLADLYSLQLSLGVLKGVLTILPLNRDTYEEYFPDGNVIENNI